jgi:hypothetical protein
MNYLIAQEFMLILKKTAMPFPDPEEFHRSLIHQAAETIASQLNISNESLKARESDIYIYTKATGFRD